MDLQPLRRWWPLAAVVALLAAAAVAAAHSTPRLDRLPRATRTGPAPTPGLPPTESPPPTPALEDTAGGVEVPSWLPTLIGAVLLVLVAAILVMMLFALVSVLVRRRHEPAGPAGAAAAAPAADEDVLAAVDAGLEDLSDLDRDPRRAVIACWLRLEETAAAVGLPRLVGDTSTDLVVRLMTGGEDRDDHGRRVVSADVLAGFAEVYREARYATHEVDARMREQARAALFRLRGELTSSVSA
jgi:hypothetical protein